MNIYLIFLLILAILIFSNLAMFGLVRGSRNMKFNFFKNTTDEIAKPFQEDSELTELRQRIEELSNNDTKKE